METPISPRTLLAGLAGILLILFIGWWLLFGAAQPAELNGQVTVNGEPLERGVISLMNIAQGNSVAAPIEQGEFRVASQSGALPGETKVSILGYKKTGKKIKMTGMPGMGQGGPPGPGSNDSQEQQEIDEEVQFLPDKFNSNTELTITLKSGRNPDEMFDLTVDEPK